MDVDFPIAYQFLFKPSRYKVMYGGRGSAKSWSVAKALLLLGYSKPLQILCAREIQKSLSDSVHKLLCQQIDAMGLADFYTATKESIVGANGTSFIFKGIRNNTQEIKSTEGIDICWVEEAQAVSSDSWDVLIPTIRKNGSEIWITFNPLDADAPTYQRFVVNPPDNAIVKKINYTDNPFFPDTLREEMEWLKAKDYQAYCHIWLGECRTLREALVFCGYFEVEDFETPRNADFYYGADFGFSNDPSTLIRCFIQDKTLYIDQEAWGIGVEIDHLPAFYEKVDGSRKWVIRADNSRPETISYVRRNGFRIQPARKWQGSIEDGIEFLKTFNIIIHPRCQHTIDEFNHYSYKIDSRTGDILPKIEDSYNHCIDALRYAVDGLIKGRGKLKMDSKVLLRRRR
jgi:phage terminase large subunit